ncbi:hypothetical protein D3C75_1363760 [compost metagenome]
MGSVAIMMTAILIPSGEVWAKALNAEEAGSMLMSSLSNSFFSFTCRGHKDGLLM